MQWNTHDNNVIIYILNRKETFCWYYQSGSKIARFKNDECVFNQEAITFRIHPKNPKLAFAHLNGTVSIAYQQSMPNFFKFKKIYRDDYLYKNCYLIIFR